jgi:CxxC motif-containing protein
MKKNLICVSCPLGCPIEVEIENGEVISVTGNTCKRGDAYARTEITNPMRSLTTSVKVEGGVHPVVPVKSAGPIPKDKMFECMERGDYEGEKNYNLLQLLAKVDLNSSTGPQGRESLCVYL